VEDEDADFFTLGGTSLAAATLVGRIRERFPTVAVRDLYDHPRLGSLAEIIDATAPAAQNINKRDVKPVSASTRLWQSLWQLPTMTQLPPICLPGCFWGPILVRTPGLVLPPPTPGRRFFSSPSLFAPPWDAFPSALSGRAC